jgi:hypothetical protein
MVERLKLKLPGGPDENLDIDTIPVMISAVDAVLTLAELVTGAELALVGWPVAIGAAFFGTFLALGSGYAEAREAIRADRTAFGYSYGLVMACDNRPGWLVARYFWERHPEYGYDFVDGGTMAQNAFNQGLVTGYWQGFELHGWQKRLIWRDLLTRTGKIRTISPQAIQHWSGTDWANWYREIGIAWRRFHMWH